MNTLERLIELEETISELSSTVASVSADIKKLICDQNTYPRKQSTTIKPGEYAKVFVNADGLVTNGCDLSASDIPDLPISSINGLNEWMINESNARTEIMKFVKKDIPARFTSNGCGTKVTYDKDGRIVSSSKLLMEDLPQISVNDITGLSEKISHIQTMVDGLQSPTISKPTFKCDPGTYTKVSVDSSGNILSGSKKLVLEDLPAEITIRLNQLETNMNNYATSNDVQYIRDKLSTKADNSNVVSGTFCKVIVNKSGIVTSGTTLNMSDLPSDLITDIRNIKADLANSVKVADMGSVHQSIANIAATNNTTTVHNLTSRIQEIENKVLNELQTMKQMINSIDKSRTNIPVDTIRNI